MYGNNIFHLWRCRFILYLSHFLFVVMIFLSSDIYAVDTTDSLTLSNFTSSKPLWLGSGTCSSVYGSTTYHGWVAFGLYVNSSNEVCYCVSFSLDTSVSNSVYSFYMAGIEGSNSRGNCAANTITFRARGVPSSSSLSCYPARALSTVTSINAYTIDLSSIASVSPDSVVDVDKYANSSSAYSQYYAAGDSSATYTKYMQFYDESTGQWVTFDKQSGQNWYATTTYTASQIESLSNGSWSSEDTLIRQLWYNESTGNYSGTVQSDLSNLTYVSSGADLVYNQAGNNVYYDTTAIQLATNLGYTDEVIAADGSTSYGVNGTGVTTSNSSVQSTVGTSEDELSALNEQIGIQKNILNSNKAENTTLAEVSSDLNDIKEILQSADDSESEGSGESSGDEYHAVDDLAQQILDAQSVDVSGQQTDGTAFQGVDAPDVGDDVSSSAPETQFVLGGQTFDLDFVHYGPLGDCASWLRQFFIWVMVLSFVYKASKVLRGIVSSSFQVGQVSTPMSGENIVPGVGTARAYTVAAITIGVLIGLPLAVVAVAESTGFWDLTSLATSPFSGAPSVVRVGVYFVDAVFPLSTSIAYVAALIALEFGSTTAFGVVSTIIKGIAG